MRICCQLMKCTRWQNVQNASENWDRFGLWVSGGCLDGYRSRAKNRGVSAGSIHPSIHRFACGFSRVHASTTPGTDRRTDRRTDRQTEGQSGKEEEAEGRLRGSHRELLAMQCREARGGEARGGSRLA